MQAPTLADEPIAGRYPNGQTATPAIWAIETMLVHVRWVALIIWVMFLVAFSSETSQI